jgi:hypothetical protein
MSDTPSAPAPVSEGGSLTGERATEHRAGYREMRAPVGETPQRKERTFDTGREAAADFAEKRRKRGHTAPDANPIFYQDTSGKRIPDEETVTVARAADDLQKHRYNDSFGVEVHDRNQLALLVDKFRADNGVPTDPTHRDETQLDPNLFGDPQSHLPPQIDPKDLPADVRHSPPPPGVDPDLHAAFQNPKVRQAVEQDMSKAVTTATTAQKHYAENVHHAQGLALSAINAAFPEMGGIKTQVQMQAFMNQLQQTNPQRWQQAQTMLNSFARLHNERGHMERQKQQIERQTFQRNAAAEDAAFNKALANVPPQQRDAVAREAVSYAQSLGVDERTLTHLLHTNPIMRSSAFRQMMFDAAAHSLARKNLAAQRQQNRAAVPHVTPPGHSNVARTTAQSANLQQLSARLTQSGSAKDAAALLIAARNARRR